MSALGLVSRVSPVQTALRNCTRDEGRLFRPYGNSGLVGRHLLSRAAISYLLTHQFRTIIWNSVPRDSKDPKGWVERCIAQIEAQDWSVVVLHDIERGCLQRLPEFLQRLARCRGHL
jgi:peptidoglycan-N-acetylglucosamine deacetylase